MNPGSGVLFGVWITAGGLSTPAESHGNPWWLWIIVFVVLAAFAGFILWWWMRGFDEEEAVPEPTRHAQAPPPVPAPPAEADDLKRIEGIGPRIAGVLQDAGITTFTQLANTPAERVGEILEAEDPRLLRLADPTTWPQQAALAAEGNWPALEELQDELKGGRKV